MQDCIPDLNIFYAVSKIPKGMTFKYTVSDIRNCDPRSIKMLAHMAFDAAKTQLLLSLPIKECADTENT
jgi:hypothetical protein